MKVLFAVSDENISDSIVKEYQKQFKEIITYKNVYYFNAIIKELQKDKTYDRIVISEDLEPFASNNFDTIDKFIFEKLDKISDEAIDDNGEDTQIIVITTDRRNFGDNMLVKFFSLGIYSALIGQDKSIENVCELIKKPRTKKDAKQYYKIDSEDANYQSENENDVSETEIQNILNHYKKISSDKYTSSFNNIVSQYNDEQLRIIINFLPVGVKAVLEGESPKYQELVMSKGKSAKQKRERTPEYEPKKVNSSYKATTQNPKPVSVNPDDIKIDMLENRNHRMTKPVIIPNEIEEGPIKRVIVSNVSEEKKGTPVTIKMEDLDKASFNDQDDDQDEEIDSINDIQEVQEAQFSEEPQKKKRGRPKKVVDETVEIPETPKKGRGRPRKVVEPENDVNLFGLDEETNDDVNLFGLDNSVTPNQKYAQQNNYSNNNNVQNNYQNPNYNAQNNVQNNVQSFQNTGYQQNRTGNVQQQMEEEYNNSILRQQYSTNVDISNLLTKDKKVVSFVGTTKNGTSFIVNNLAELLSSMGISTAILDMTQSRNAYYIYTNNEERLRKICDNCIGNLRSNIAEGIRVNKNLTVFSPVPGTTPNIDDVGNILSTLVQNYSLVLIDCDFNTPIEYFHSSQEIYLVQSMDVLTIQPLTAFLRDLKDKGILEESKLRIIINKEQKISGISPKVIVGGMAFYNDPSMSFMTELFNRDAVKFVTIPFEEQNYVAYLEALINCRITLKTYTKTLNSRLKELANMVYPLIGQQFGKSTFANVNNNNVGNNNAFGIGRRF